MALETLKNVNEIGGFKVTRDMDDLESFVMIDEEVNGIAFKIQNGPIKEYGINGCQLDTLIEAAKLMLEELNKKFPCRENAMAITKLDESLMWLDKRKKDREKRGVEGKSEL